MAAGGERAAAHDAPLPPVTVARFQEATRLIEVLVERAQVEHAHTVPLGIGQVGGAHVFHEPDAEVFPGQRRVHHDAAARIAEGVLLGHG